MKTARPAPALLLLALCAFQTNWADAAAEAHPPKPGKPAAAKPAPDSASATEEATAPPTDPMEQLRRRLAERLQNPKAGSTVSASASQQDTLVVSRPAKPPAQPAAAPSVEPKVPPRPDSPARVPSAGVVPVAAHLTSPPVHGATAAAAAPHVAANPAAPASAAVRAARPRPVAKPAAVHGSEAHWEYVGPAGPQTWGGLRPEFSLCGIGQRQSPIDIRGGLAVDLEPVRFDYHSSRFSVIDNGHTVQANIASGNAVEIGGRRFELQQFHFHRPSEERIDGRQFEMSVHMVHKDPMGKLAVVALLLEKGPAQGAVQKVWNNLPLERDQDVPARVALDLNELLPADHRYYTYMGSLTTPPCTEDVQWVVMRQPVTVSPEQIELFARIYPMNARPVQQAAGRRILQSN